MDFKFYIFRGLKAWMSDFVSSNLLFLMEYMKVIREMHMGMKVFP